MPTLLDAAGIQLPPHLSGVSLLPLATGEATAVKDAALMEHAGWVTLRTTTHRYLLHEDGHEALFDLTAPWGEYRDVAAQQADVVADCRHRLLQRLLSMARPRTRIWPY